MKRIPLLFYWGFQSLILDAQDLNSISITFQPLFGNSQVQLNEKYFKFSNGDSIQFQSLQFYVSEIAFFNNEDLIYREENSFHLVNATEPKTQQINFSLPGTTAATHLNFNLGIDSVTNVSGAMGGDLDPTKGMYWTWQSGYINFKLEGKSNRCKTRNNEYQFHLGGYQFPLNSIQKISLDITGKKFIPALRQ